MDTERTCTLCGGTDGVESYTPFDTDITVLLCSSCVDDTPKTNERVFNIGNGHVGVVQQRDDERVTVTDTFTKNDVCWPNDHVIPDWHRVTDECIGFIKCHMVQLWATHPHPQRVYKLACMLAYGGGEGFNETLLDVMSTWSPDDDVYQMVHMYLSDALNA